MKKLRIGTRGSKLALLQANIVKNKILANFNEFTEQDIEIIKIKTTGDKILNKTLSDIGGKSLFTKEIEDALLDNRINLAVHSLKDFTAKLPNGLSIKAVLKREDPRDSLVSLWGKDVSINNIPENSVIGTASCRRKAQLLNIRRDLQIKVIRGNVITRIERLKNKEYDALMLAAAGLKRLNIDRNLYSNLPIDTILPAPGQGVICVETLTNDDFIDEICQKINHLETYYCSLAEQGFTEALEADCSSALAAYAIMENDNQIYLRTEIYSPDGSEKSTCADYSDLYSAYDLGKKLGYKLKDKLDRWQC